MDVEHDKIEPCILHQIETDLLVMIRLQSLCHNPIHRCELYSIYCYLQPETNTNQKCTSSNTS